MRHLDGLEHIPLVREFDVEDLPKGEVSRLRVTMVTNALGQLLSLPVIVIKGKKPGPVLGITAAVHGDELNGLQTIHRVLQEISVTHLSGTIVAVPVVNLPGFLNNVREFTDGSDLNRVMPGKLHGNIGEIFAHRFTKKITKKLDYLIDLHTASFGRVNSLYVRADLSEKKTAVMAKLQNPQIIVNHVGRDGTLRGAAAVLGIPAITVEIGNPILLQSKLIKSSLVGITNVLSHLKMIQRKEKIYHHKTVICKKSYWMRTDQGGILEVFPQVTDLVKKGELIARVQNIFGDLLREYVAPEDGIVVGKSINPVNQTGSRILHLGIKA